MNRREFVAAGCLGTLGTVAPLSSIQESIHVNTDDIRLLFPWLKEEVYLNAAGMMPLGSFSQEGLERYIAYQRSGNGNGRLAYVRDMQKNIRTLFAEIIHADEPEIGLVHCTKAGEQLVIDALDILGSGKNIVTNDLHFNGSLHNYVGLQKAGVDVRIVRSTNWQIDLDDMEAAVDEDTALVSVSLTSNINGHVEKVKELSDVAHAKGAILYADIIQAAGITPVDVKAMGIDVAACSCYKWLYGVHGTGFIYVSAPLQGTRLADRLFPGNMRFNYPPWVDEQDDAHDEYVFKGRNDATRFQPGHVSYLGYCATFEGMKFLRKIGRERALAHSVQLNEYLRSRLDSDRYVCISPDPNATPINTFLLPDVARMKDKLNEANIAVSISDNRMRVSPALYNNFGDMDRLIAVMNRE